MKNIILPAKVYAILKWFCLLAIPALGWGYGKLAVVWGLPFGEQIPQTLEILGFVLGALIGISHINFYKDKDTEPVMDEDIDK